MLGLKNEFFGEKLECPLVTAIIFTPRNATSWTFKLECKSRGESAWSTISGVLQRHCAFIHQSGHDAVGRCVSIIVAFARPLNVVVVGFCWRRWKLKYVKTKKKVETMTSILRTREHSLFPHTANSPTNTRNRGFIQNYLKIHFSILSRPFRSLVPVLTHSKGQRCHKFHASLLMLYVIVYLSCVSSLTARW